MQKYKLEGRSLIVSANVNYTYLKYPPGGDAFSVFRQSLIVHFHPFSSPHETVMVVFLNGRLNSP